VEIYGWNVVFWARIPLVLGAFVLSGLIPARPGHGSSSGLDPIGSLQLAVALCAILLGLSVRIEAIGMALPLGIVGLGIALLAAFARRQSRRTQPIIRPALFRDPAFTLMNIASVVANFAAFSIVFIGPFFLISIFRFNASQAGLVLAVNALGMIIGASVAARLIRRMGGSRVAGVGLVMSAFGLLGVAAWSVDVPISLMVTPLVVQGLGIGLFQVAYTDLVTATLPVADRGVAGSLTMVTRTVGVVSGASGHAALHRYFEGAAAKAGATGIDPFMAGFRAVFVVAAGVQILAIVGGALITRYVHRRGTVGRQGN
jgi:predicted MFS family arabinose efflux permease